MNSFFTLILFAHASILSNGDSNSMTTVTGFFDRARCVAAGEAAKQIANGTTKVIKYVCVEVQRG